MVYTGVSAMYVCTWACASIFVCACVFKSSGKARGVRLGPLPSVYEVKVVFFILYAQLFPPVFESMFARRIMFSSIRSKSNILGSEWKFLHSGAGCSHEGIKETGGFFFFFCCCVIMKSCMDGTNAIIFLQSQWTSNCFKLLNSGIYFPAIEQEVKARKQEPQLASADIHCNQVKPKRCCQCFLQNWTVSKYSYTMRFHNRFFFFFFLLLVIKH